MAAGAPLALRAIKEVGTAVETVGIKEGFALLRSGELPGYIRMLESEHAAEGPRAFAEKSDPRWRCR
ncbi:hypothetical protein JCM18882A_23410 [Brevibacterium metallidurans]|uniref:Enoyl-CoA hydratase n=2 Tax=Brevibacterium TaxID=1696 RepID=A0ABP9U1P7_9MICO